MGKNCASHSEQMTPASPYDLCVLGKHSLTTKAGIQMSVLPLQLIHLTRVIYVNSLTGIKGVIYLQAVSCVRICRIRPFRRTANFSALHVAKSQSEMN